VRSLYAGLCVGFSKPNSSIISIWSGGRGGIRTHGTLAGTPVFKTGALNHSATLPSQRYQSLSRLKIKNRLRTGPNLAPMPLAFFCQLGPLLI
jgi:hypothetical protein